MVRMILIPDTEKVAPVDAVRVEALVSSASGKPTAEAEKRQELRTLRRVCTSGATYLGGFASTWTVAVANDVVVSGSAAWTTVTTLGVIGSVVAGVGVLLSGPEIPGVRRALRAEAEAGRVGTPLVLDDSAAEADVVAVTALQRWWGAAQTLPSLPLSVATEVMQARSAAARVQQLRGALNRLEELVEDDRQLEELIRQQADLSAAAEASAARCSRLAAYLQRAVDRAAAGETDPFGGGREIDDDPAIRAIQLESELYRTGLVAARVAEDVEREGLIARALTEPTRPALMSKETAR